MGHAGAIIEGNAGTAESKMEALEDAGCYVAKTAADIGDKMMEAMKAAGLA
jgi:succinyl-CoA synthetase alpha subunit